MPSDEAPRPPPAPLSFGWLEQAADGDAATPGARYTRALARMAVGRDVEARHDLEAVVHDLGDAATVELAYLELRQRGDARRALRAARRVARRACDTPALRARALHVVGMAYDRLRRTGRALSALLEAARLYETSDSPLARAHVEDTIGLVHATRGRLEEATFHFALSLVDKAVLGDRRGLAVTIGNLGRVQLRLGRYADAVRCFERDLAMAREQGDVRAQARMHEDLGRARAGLGDDARAEEDLLACLRLAQRHGHREIAFFAHLELAELHLRHGRVTAARAALAQALAATPADSSPYHRGSVEVVRGAILLEEGEEAGLDVLRDAVRVLARADAPDLEIPARIRLARAYAERRLKAAAADVLLEGARRARRTGYQRYLPALAEAMTGLELVEGALEERPRRRAPGDAPADGSYVILEPLGAGAVGEVWRAYDPVRGREVALKVFHLERLYDVEARQRVLASARVEVEIASRVRHPGVARVFAIGPEEDGGFYVVQEYVAGRPLRAVMRAEPEPVPARVTALGAALAFALAALHEVGAVHRDLKPENVIVRDDGTPVIVDLGLAHRLADRALPGLVGTLEYMAPEQARGDGVDARADLYALGVILFEWLVGFRPLRQQGRTLARWLEALATEDAPRLAEFRPDVPPALDDGIARLLAKDPARRPASAAELGRALKHIATAPGKAGS